jgi:putative flippase GtrA
MRLIKFSAVGAAGIVVQLAALTLLRSGLHVQYLPATALAVETAVLHNYVWHECWTWRDRTGGHRGFAARLLRFNFTTGMVSIAVNLAMMRLLVGRFHLPYLAANLIAIAVGSLANYLAADWWVFRSTNTRIPAEADEPDAGGAHFRASVRPAAMSQGRRSGEPANARIRVLVQSVRARRYERSV